MARLSADNAQQLKPVAANRRGLGSIIGWILVAALFLAEFISSISQWRSANRDGVFSVALFSLAFLSMIWMAALLTAEGYARLLCRVQYLGWARIFYLLRAGAALAVAGCWAFVVFDLEVRQGVGCYLNPALLDFTWNNMQNGLWVHMAAKDRWLFGLMVVFLAATTPLVFLHAWRNAARLRLLGDPRLRRPVLGLMLAVAVSFTLSTLLINRDEYAALRTRTVRHLSYQLEPMLAFGFGCADIYLDLYDDSHRLDESRLTFLSTPPVVFPKLNDSPNIIFFQVESCRADVIDEVHQGIEVTPNMNALARKSTRFPKAYAPGTHTSLSNVSIPTSTYALRRAVFWRYERNDPGPRKTIYDVLKPLGYDTAWYSSDFEGWMGMRNYIKTPSLDVYIDALSMQADVHPEWYQMRDLTVNLELEPDNETLRRAMGWMDGELKKKKPFYITISVKDSHFPYVSSVHSNVFQPCGVPEGCTAFDFPPPYREQIRNTYLNAIHGIDILFGQLMTFLKQRGADQHTIIVIYGDHGEAFGENGIVMHGVLPYETIARTPLIFYGNGYFPPAREDYPASLVDIVPTVLARLGEPSCPNFQGIDLLSPSRPPLASRCVYIHCDGRVNGDGLLAAGRWKYFTDNDSGACHLYDLAGDPGESNNLVNANPAIAEILSRQLATFCADQLTYYRSPHYYKMFYPPPPVQLASANAPAH